jgi:hypothetical protein
MTAVTKQQLDQMAAEHARILKDDIRRKMTSLMQTPTHPELIIGEVQQMTALTHDIIRKARNTQSLFATLSLEYSRLVRMLERQFNYERHGVDERELAFGNWSLDFVLPSETPDDEQAFPWRVVHDKLVSEEKFENYDKARARFLEQALGIQ